MNHPVAHFQLKDKKGRVDLTNQRTSSGSLRTSPTIFSKLRITDIFCRVFSGNSMFCKSAGAVWIKRKAKG